jgi:hypothetical protein
MRNLWLRFAPMAAVESMFLLQYRGAGEVDGEGLAVSTDEWAKLLSEQTDVGETQETTSVGHGCVGVETAKGFHFFLLLLLGHLPVGEMGGGRRYDATVVSGVPRQALMGRLCF